MARSEPLSYRALSIKAIALQSGERTSEAQARRQWRVRTSRPGDEERTCCRRGDM